MKTKQTEIGIIPEDWEVKRLGEIGRFSKGQAIKKDEANSGDIPCIRYGELYTKHDEVIRKCYSFISESIAKTSKILKKGDILFAGSGETKADIGKCASFVDDFETYAGGDIVIMTPSNSNSIFLGYLLNSPLISKQKANKGQGDAVVHISASSLKLVQIPIPPLAEQKRIAEALSDMDALISNFDALIDKKRNLKQATMQTLLTPKDGWEVKKLGDCLLKNPDYGINAAAVKFSDRLPVYLRITDISDDGRFLKNGITSVDDVNSSNYVLSENEIVFARTGASVGKTYLYDKKDGELVFAGFLIRAKINSNMLNSRFLKGFTESRKYWNWIKVMSMRSGQPGINSVEYAQLEIPLPPLNEQQSIAQILSDMDSELEGLEGKRAKYKTLKTGMMQELLTGRVRLV